MEIVILGAGVAGVCCAIALKQKGFDVCLYERQQCASNIGAGIVLWPNAVYILEQLGVLDEIKAVSGCPTKMQRVSSVGENLGAIDIEDLNKHMGLTSLSILRRDFQNILLGKLASMDITIQYNHTVTNIETTVAGNAEVHFENGLKTTAKLVIGADGRMTSPSRQYILGDNKPIYQGFINWIGVFESSQNVFTQLEIQDFWGVGERFGIVPIAKNKAYWAGAIASTNIAINNAAEYKHELNSVFDSWPAVINSMINETPLQWINKIYVHDHEPIPIWHKNNLVIIGDAAHAALPTSGQGACLALEDAWLLANCLEYNMKNIQPALLKFTELRYTKTTSIIKAARSFAASLFNTDKKFCQQRNENSKKTDYAELVTSMAKIWGQGLPLKT